MATKFEHGDHVKWNTPQGEITGKVLKRLTKSTYIRAHKVAATPNNPEYVVQSDRSGKRAAHKSSALKKA
jgi:hypothetical protein